MNLRFKDKVVLVTGAAGGIGRATSERFAREGAIVAAVDVNAARLEDLAAKLRADRSMARAYPCDACDPDQVAQTVAAVSNEFGRIDVLVNNVGGGTVIPNFSRPVEELSVDEWRRLVSLNLETTFLFSKATIPIMKSQRSGKIVNVSSLAAHGPGLFSGAGYVAAKGGVNSLTKKMSFELGPFGINVNGISPSLTLSDSGTQNWESNTEAQKQAAIERVPLRRVSTTEDQAAVICFLASPDADFVTGVTIDVTGGQ